MCEQSSLSGSSPSSPRVIARRRLVSREPRVDMADDEVNDENMIAVYRGTRCAEGVGARDETAGARGKCLVGGRKYNAMDKEMEIDIDSK